MRIPSPPPITCLQGLRAINQLEGGIAPLATSQDLHAMGFHIVLHPLTGKGGMAGGWGTPEQDVLAAGEGRVHAALAAAGRRAGRCQRGKRSWGRRGVCKHVPLAICVQRAAQQQVAVPNSCPALSPAAALYTATRALMESYGSLAENGTTTQEALKQMVGWRVSPAQPVQQGRTGRPLVPASAWVWSSPGSSSSLSAEGIAGSLGELAAEAGAWACGESVLGWGFPKGHLACPFSSVPITIRPLSPLIRLTLDACLPWLLRSSTSWWAWTTGWSR